jgi:hypothetical protein
VFMGWFQGERAEAEKITAEGKPFKPRKRCRANPQGGSAPSARPGLRLTRCESAPVFPFFATGKSEEASAPH